MLKKILFSLLVILLMVLPLLTSCNGTGRTPSQTAAPAGENWWDKFGEPEYGGTITFALPADTAGFDPYGWMGNDHNYWYEPLFYPDWTVDREIWSFQGQFTPEEYFAGHLIETWEWTDATTFIGHVNKDARWQDKPPVNGREFTADDIVFHYDRSLGKGHGYTEPAPIAGQMLSNLEKVTALDKHTVEFKFKTPCSGIGFYTLADQACLNWCEAEEWVALAGEHPVTVSTGNELADWKNVVGTGPWMLTDFVENSSRTFSRNPNYWLNDPRHPENPVPYADTLKIVVVPDSASRLAALRTGKLDILGGYGGTSDVTWQQAQALENTDLERTTLVTGGAFGMAYRNDTKPFTDINVRIALDMAVDRKAIAESYYGGFTDGTPCGLITQMYTGWCYAYEDWPQELKDEYAYNPEKARQMLADAGYPNGFSTNVICYQDTEGYEVLKAYLMEVGVDMEIRVMDAAAFSSFSREGKHDQMSASGQGFDWPPNRVITHYHPSGSDHGVNRVDDPIYNEAFDEFFNAGTSAEAAAAVQKADKRSVEQHWGLFVTGAGEYVFWQPYLKGYSGEVRFWSQQILWSRLWIDQDLKKSMGR